MTFSSRILAAGAALVAGTSALAAQCPDGTPPPCDTRRAATTTAIPRRINPPLDDKTWIVLPFNNVTRAPDTEWLGDASVNLLSMDLSRWQDVKVIDDRRVADFMRELTRPANSKLSYNDGATVARRAGAGRMVIGDVLKVGNRTTVTATVYNVRDGKQIRTAREAATVGDSIMPMFGKLARQILAVPATDANIGSVGTSRADAYKEYVGGVQALNTFDSEGAKRHFEEALRLDTAFALAHYKWAIAALYDYRAAAARSSQVKLSEYGNVMKLTEDTAQIRHANTAARLASRLPAREQKLIAGLRALLTDDFPRACESYGSLVQVDSSDVEALYGYGICQLSDDMVVVVGGDTTNLRFRGSWNAALTAFRRALIVDPTFHLSFDAVVRTLTTGRWGCRHAEVIITCADTASQPRYTATMIRRGDSLVHVPVAMGRTAGPTDQVLRAIAWQPPRENLEAARAAAADWVAAGPGEGRAHKYLASMLLKLGQPAAAEPHLREAMLDPALKGDAETWLMRLDIAVKLRQGREAVALIDSTYTVIPGELGVGSYASFAPITGRVRITDSIYISALKRQNAPASVIGAFTESTRVTIGAGTDSIRIFEQGYYDLGKSTSCGARCVQLFGTAFMFGIRSNHVWPLFRPEVDTILRLLPAVALSRNDTAALRVAARKLDSVSIATARSGGLEDGSSVIATDAYLLLGDSVAALTTLRRAMDSTFLTTSIQSMVNVGATQVGLFWPRAMVLRADLEARMARGDKEVARQLYAGFLDLWSGADPEFAPLIARVKAAHAALPR